MHSTNLIKDIIEKIKLWFKNLFRKKKIIEKNNKNIQENNIKKNNKIYFTKTIFDNENKDNNIGTFYPKLNIKNLELLINKGLSLKRKVIGYKANNKDILIIDEIINNLKENDIYINQGIEINILLNEINNSQELNLNTNQKLNILKDSISNILDKKLDEYENNIIKKAYIEYNTVNYIIVTTLIIDDLINEINELNEDLIKNKYNRVEYEQKLNKIKEKIEKLVLINNRNEVQTEIENLRKDFYTKKKDKYDLLYNEEIFINLNERCDELLNLFIKKENNIKKQNKIEFKKKIDFDEKKKQDIIKEKSKKEQEQKEINDNILKRFIDIEFAHKLLLLRERMRKKLYTKEEIYHETIQYYNDFLYGEQQQFNFERNKIKTEIAKLYNDVTSTICIMEKKEFIPLEHINIKLEVLTEKTLENKNILNYMIEKKHKYKIEEHETSRAVTTKLTSILEKEKKQKKEKDKEKVLKKEYIHKKESSNNEKDKN